MDNNLRNNLWPEVNTIKTREDTCPYHFQRQAASQQDSSRGEEMQPNGKKCQPRFVATGGMGDPSWSKDGAFSLQTLRDRIEPWLTALVQSEHLSLLLGSGFSRAAAGLVGGKGQSMECTPFTAFGTEIEDAAHQLSAKRGAVNMEDRFRVASDLLKGLPILKDARADLLRRELAEKKSALVMGVLAGERELAVAEAKAREKAWSLLVSFLMSFASRIGAKDRLGIFTTNYDRIIEEASDLAGLHLLDRFTGILSPVFRSSRLHVDMHYNPPGIRGEPRYLEGVARFTKLHGSVDWVQCGDLIRRIGLPFGAASIEPYLKVPGLPETNEAFGSLIYPTAAKDRETAEYPFVDLFRDFAAAICQPNSTVFTYGYGFGDDHINRVLKDMLTLPSTHLVIISYDAVGGRIQRFWEGNEERKAQMTLLIGKDVANLEALTRDFLPKSSIEVVTSRMAELLSKRYVITGDSRDSARNGDVEQGENA